MRTLRRQPAFAAVVVLTQALGIGANTAIFSVVNAVVLRPLKTADADALVRFSITTGATTSIVGTQQYEAWRRLSTVVEDVAAHRLEYVNLTEGGDLEQIPVARVTASFFRVFHAPIAIGRAFSDNEDRPGAPLTAVISSALWSRRFGSDPAAVGARILLGSIPHVIVGVVDRSFDSEQFEPAPDVWVPFQIDPQRDDGGNLFTVTGRLTPDATIASANAQLAVAVADARREAPTRVSARMTWTVEPLQDAMIGGVRSSLTLLLAAVGALLLIACANVANLLLVRADVRRREIAVRTALGATRAQIVRLLLAESAVLALVGGVLGLGAGALGVRLLLSLAPVANPFKLGDVAGGATMIPRIGSDGLLLDWRVPASASAATLSTIVLFGLLPALHAARVDLVDSMKRIASTGLGRRGGPRGAFVAVEFALALMLLTGAALLIRTSMALRAVPAGFEASGVVTMRTSVTATRYETRAGLEQLTRESIARMRAVPGVVAATATCCMPLETVWQLPFVVSGRPPESMTRSGALAFNGFAGWTFVAPGYFETLRIPVLRGRDFSDVDTAGAPGVVIINEEMARRYWPNGDPLSDRLVIGKGMRPEYDQEPIRQVVGIVGSVRDTGLTKPARPAMYVPMAQEPDGVTKLNVRLLPIVWMARTSGAPASSSPALARAVERAGGLPVARIRSMDDVVSESIARTRFNTWLMTLFGACALLLAAVGVYGLMAYAVQRRTAEIGIRIALGAEPARVRALVLRQGAAVALAGVTAGFGASWWLARLLSGLLFGVTPRDPAVFVIAPLALFGIAMAAAWLPARRAARLDPLTALRQE